MSARALRGWKLLKTRKRKRKSDPSNDKSNVKKNAFIDPPVLPSRSASHLTDDLGFIKQAKVKATFGKKNATFQANRKPRGSHNESHPSGFMPQMTDIAPSQTSCQNSLKLLFPRSLAIRFEKAPSSSWPVALSLLQSDVLDA